MAESIKIGPITIADRAHLYDGNEAPSEIESNREAFRGLNVVTVGGVSEGNEAFTIECTNTEALLIRGVMKQGQLVWIDTSTNLVANEDFRHRGWYVLTSAKPRFSLGPGRVSLEIEAQKISPNADEFLEMDYTPGTNDGTVVYSEYVETTPLNIFSDTFTTFDTTNVWNAAQSWNVTGATVTPISGALSFYGHRSSTSREGVIWTYAKATYKAPFTIETHLEATPAVPPSGQQQEMWLTLMRGAPTSYGFLDPTFLNYGLIQASSGKRVYLRAETIKGFIYYKNQTVTTVTPGLKLKYYADGQIETWLDTGAGYAQFTSKFNPGIGGVFNPTYIALWYATFATPTDYPMRVQDITITNDVNVAGKNIIHLPITSTAYVPVTPTFTRTGAEGAMKCYTDPGDDLTFQIDPAQLYTGSVKAYNTNHVGATAYQLLNTDEELTSTSWYVQNGLCKIAYNGGVQFSYSTGGAYTVLNTFTYATAPRLFRPIEISPERVTIQLDRTYWTLERGKRFVRVQHPYDDLGMTIKTCYWHDGITTTSPAAAADVSMTTNFYTNIWSYGSGSCAAPNPVQDVRLQVLRSIPGPIKSDKLLAASNTGIAWYLNTITSTDPDGSTYNAWEYNIQPECVIKVRRP